MIIPSQTFTSPYPEILNSIDGVITKTERKLLILFEKYCYRDGRIFPKIKTIAWKLDISTRQVQRLIASLVKKGFIKVIPASLLHRHLYGKGNQYHLLDHPAYHRDQSKMSSEMFHEIQDHTIYNNKYIKNKNGSDFNILKWLEQNKEKHGQAILDALNALTARWPSIRLPSQYAQTIVDVQSGNYNAADYTAQAKQEVAEINEGYTKIAETLGIELLENRNLPREETPMEIAERLNRQRNELFNLYQLE